VGFASFTGGDFGGGVVPECGPHHGGKRLAIWRGIAPQGWTDDGVDVEMNEGDYDLATCKATPVRSLEGRARAVVRGFVYALRVRDVDPDEEEPPPPDQVVIFLPHGAMVAATADPEMPLATTDTGTFTRLSFSLEDGEGSSASVRVSPASLRLWSRLRASAAQGPAFSDESAPHDDLVLAIDVARQGDTTLASVSVALPPRVSPAPYAKLLAAMQAPAAR
jgi:hypothetical protein